MILPGLRAFALFSFVALLSAYNASAQQTKPATETSGIKAGGKSLGMVTGSLTGTYYRFGNDIRKAVLPDDVKIDVKESTGSVDNINRITSNENAALGIVQSDVLGFLMRSQEPQSKKIAENLRMVFPFYQEEVHVIALSHVRNFYHLNGKTVIVGPNGSGSWLTAMNLFNLTGVRPAKLLRLSAEEGLIEILRGRADAMIFVGGKPVKLFENLNQVIEEKDKELERVHLVALDDKKLLAEYAPAQITPADYKFVDRNIPTIAVTAVLVTYNFASEDSTYAQARCDEIHKFSKSLSGRVDELRKSGHPKWREVNLNADVGVWKRDECSVSNPATKSIENELLETLDMKW